MQKTREPLLTMSVPEAAAALGISRGSAYELARRNELPGAIRLGGRVVVSRSALHRAIEGPTASGKTVSATEL